MGYHGKTLNLPVYKLLGGHVNKRMWAYASSLRFRGMDIIHKDAQRFLDMGFNAMKIKIGKDPLNYKDDICFITELRKILGDDITLMADANCAYSENIKVAIEIGKALSDLGIFWFEEPISPDNVEGYEYLHSQLSIPLAAEEAEFTRFGFRQFFTRKAIDIVQPNVCCAGGLTEAKKIAALASTFHIPYAPHTGSSSAVCMAASLHLAASLPCFLIYEYMQNDWSKDHKILYFGIWSNYP